MVLMYVLVGILVITNIAIIAMYFKEKSEVKEIIKNTTEVQMTIESLRTTVKNISEEFYSLDRLIDARIQAHVNRLNETIESTVLVDEPTLDDKYLDQQLSETVDNMGIENPYKEKSMSFEEIIEKYPELKKGIERNGVSGRLPGIIEGETIDLGGVQ